MGYALVVYASGDAIDSVVVSSEGKPILQGVGVGTMNMVLKKNGSRWDVYGYDPNGYGKNGLNKDGLTYLDENGIQHNIPDEGETFKTESGNTYVIPVGESIPVLMIEGTPYLVETASYVRQNGWSEETYENGTTTETYISGYTTETYESDTNIETYISGYKTETYQSGTKTETYISGYKTETYQSGTSYSVTKCLSGSVQPTCTTTDVNQATYNSTVTGCTTPTNRGQIKTCITKSSSPIYSTRQVPVYSTRTVPVYSTRQVPVYETRTVPVYSTRQVPVYETLTEHTYATLNSDGTISITNDRLPDIL